MASGSAASDAEEALAEATELAEMRDSFQEDEEDDNNNQNNKNNSNNKSSSKKKSSKKKTDPMTKRKTMTATVAASVAGASFDSDGSAAYADVSGMLEDYQRLVDGELTRQANATLTAAGGTKAAAGATEALPEGHTPVPIVRLGDEVVYYPSDALGERLANEQYAYLLEEGMSYLYDNLLWLIVRRLMPPSGRGMANGILPWYRVCTFLGTAHEEDEALFRDGFVEFFRQQIVLKQRCLCIVDGGCQTLARIIHDARAVVLREKEKIHKYWFPILCVFPDGLLRYGKEADFPPVPPDSPYNRMPVYVQPGKEPFDFAFLVEGEVWKDRIMPLTYLILRFAAVIEPGFDRKAIFLCGGAADEWLEICVGVTIKAPWDMHILPALPLLNLGSRKKVLQGLIVGNIREDDLQDGFLKTLYKSVPRLPPAPHIYKLLMWHLQGEPSEAQFTYDKVINKRFNDFSKERIKSHPHHQPYLAHVHRNETLKLTAEAEETLKRNAPSNYVKGMFLEALMHENMEATKKILESFDDTEEGKQGLKTFLNSPLEWNGYMPLLVAALARRDSKKKPDVVRYILNKGANLTFQTGLGLSVLHIAVLNSDDELVEELLLQERKIDAKRGRRNCLRVLENNYGRSAIDICIDQGEEKILTKLLRDKGVNVDSTQILHMISKTPQATKLVFDQVAGLNMPNHANHLQFDFDLIFDYENRSLWMENTVADFLRALVAKGDPKLLFHPVVTRLILAKWSRYRYVFYFNYLFYMAFVACLIAYCLLGPYTDPTPPLGTALGILALSRLILELLQFIRGLKLTRRNYQLAHWWNRLEYFADIANYFELFIFIGSFLLGFGFIPAAHWPGIASFVMICSWLDLIIFARQLLLFDFGLFPIMLVGVFKTFGRVAILFATLLMGFSLSFYILFRSSPETTTTLGATVHQTIMMFLGDFDFYKERVTEIADPTPQINAEIVMGCIFFISMPLLFLNFTIGLTVGDIQQIQQNASFRSRAMKIRSVLEIESGLPSIFRVKLRHIAKKPAMKIHEEAQFSEETQMLLDRLDELPAELIQEIGSSNEIGDLQNDINTIKASLRELKGMVVEMRTGGYAESIRSSEDLEDQHDFLFEDHKAEDEYQYD